MRCLAGAGRPQAPGQDALRKAHKLLDAQRWREAVRAAGASGTPPDDLLCRAVDALAGQLQEVPRRCHAALMQPWHGW